MKTIHEAAASLRAGKTTPLDLVEMCLANIDRWESKVRAWVFVDRDYARAEARRLGDELKKGQYRGPLHGLPIAVKDIFDVFDWPTAAGSKLWANSIARQDAEVVRRLRCAGAIFLGKTVTTQFASFDPPVTRNPWNLDRTPGGSSSGSAAALATGMCLGALGSQTGGSITRPATYCGVAGFKPTYGRVPLDGIMPLALSMDHPGPMGRCVRDLEIMYEVMGDGYEKEFPSPRGRGVGGEGLTEPPSLGRFHGLFDDLAEPGVEKAVTEIFLKLKDKAKSVRDVSLPASFSEVIQRHRVVMAVEGAQFHHLRLERHPEDYPPKIRQLLEEGLACPAPEYAACKAHQEMLTREMRRLVDGDRVYIVPATTGPAPDTTSTGNPAFNSPWSYTGLPVVSFPTGQFINGLPLAIQLVGAPGREDHLFQVAAWCELALGRTEPLEPKFPG